MKSLIARYNSNKSQIISRLEEFKSLKEENYFPELIFCLLTPQSNAKKCWQAAQLISKLKNPTSSQIKSILKTRTRFHNNKSSYIQEAIKNKFQILAQLEKENDTLETRNWLTKNVKGLGLKEASHFLRNIGKSNNQITILDRHILTNLNSLNIIKEKNIKNPKHYLEIEDKFISFSKQINIPIDHLDLLFWSQQTGEIFK
jgi:N-glycosylase/DNA lyase